MIGLAKQVPDLEGIELVEGWHVSADTLKDVKELVKEAGLVVTVVHPDLWTTKKWAFGALAASDKKTRELAIGVVRSAMDMSEQLGANLVDVWFGQDGWEYALTQDYMKAWELRRSPWCVTTIPMFVWALSIRSKSPAFTCTSVPWAR